MQMVRQLAASVCVVAVLVPAVVGQEIERSSRVPGPASNLIVPQARAYVVRPSAQPIRIAAVEVSVNILEQVAATSMTVALENPAGSPQEAELLLPVPDRAAVRSFTISGQSQEATARLLPLAEARALYDSIVRSLRDPGLLEFAGFGLIRSSVFPIPARGSQMVHVVYEHILDGEGDRVDYVLPRTEAFESTQVPWKISVRVQSKRPISTAYSPSHEIVTERDSGHAVRIRLASEGHVEPGPFRLSYLVEGNGLTASLLAYPEPSMDGGYFMLIAGAPPKPADTTSIKREVTMVIDCSGSMAGEKLEQARAAALQIVESLGPGEAFNVIDFSESVENFEARPVIKDDRTLAAGRRYIRALQSRGGTNIHDALIEAVQQPVTPGMLPLVLFLTDGLPTVGQTGELQIRNDTARANTHKRRIFAIGVGYDVNAPLLAAIADGSRATSSFVLPGENVEAKVGQTFKRLAGPVLAEPVVETLDTTGNPTTRAVRDLLPEQPNDLFEGDQLVLLGKYSSGDKLRFRITGNYLGHRRSFAFEFDLNNPSAKNAFIPRLWARRKITRLTEAITAAGADGRADPRVDPHLKELVDEIVKLSTEFGILTEYTAFLATDGVDLTNREMVRSAAAENFKERAVDTRSGMASVNQQLNANAHKGTAAISKSNVYYDANMQRVEITTVQQIQDRTFFKKKKRWVDARVVETADADRPDQIVDVGSREFDQLVDRLVTEGRQGVLALSGEIMLVVDGKKVLLRAGTK